MDKKSIDGDMDRAYSPSSVAGNYLEVVAAYGERSEQTMRRLPHAIVRYGADDDEYIVVFEPQAGQPYDAMLVFFHGGYWQALSARDACFPAQMLTERGFAYAAVNYSLAPKAGIASIVGQCIGALKLLAARAPHARLVIAGSSAGAHLAAMLMTTDWVAARMTKAPFTAALLISGIYDLQPLVGTYINAPLGLDIDSARRLSPMRLPLRSPVDTVVCWGEHETDAFKQQSLGFSTALARAGAHTSMHEVGHKNHFDILFDLMDPSTRLSIDTLSLLGEKP